MLERLHGIGAKLQAGSYFLENRRLFEHGYRVAAPDQTTGHREPRYSSASDKKGLTRHGSAPCLIVTEGAYKRCGSDPQLVPIARDMANRAEPEEVI